MFQNHIRLHTLLTTGPTQFLDWVHWTPTMLLLQGEHLSFFRHSPFISISFSSICAYWFVWISLSLCVCVCVWFVICDLWFVICDLWFVICKWLSKHEYCEHLLRWKNSNRNNESKYSKEPEELKIAEMEKMCEASSTMKSGCEWVVLEVTNSNHGVVPTGQHLHCYKPLQFQITMLHRRGGDFFQQFSVGFLLDHSTAFQGRR